LAFTGLDSFSHRFMKGGTPKPEQNPYPIDRQFRNATALGRVSNSNCHKTVLKFIQELVPQPQHVQRHPSLSESAVESRGHFDIARGAKTLGRPPAQNSVPRSPERQHSSGNRANRRCFTHLTTRIDRIRRKIRSTRRTDVVLRI
jgi:hypothetical protein